MPATFIQISLETLKSMRNAKLTGTQYELWLLLCSLDPWGDRLIDIPSPDELAATLGVNVRTITRAAARLEDLGLFQFQIKGWKGRNKQGAKSDFPTDKGIHSMTNGSNSMTNGSKNLTERSEIGQNDPILNLKPAPSKGFSAPHTLTENTYNPYTECVPDFINSEVGAIAARLPLENPLSPAMIETINAVAPDVACAALEAVIEAKPASVIGAVRVALREQWQPKRRVVPKIVDLGDLIAEIDIACARLGWRRDGAIGHMIARYHWRPCIFSAISHADLVALRDELQELTKNASLRDASISS